MCYEFNDPVAIEIMKVHMTGLVIVMFVLVQAEMWYKKYLGKTQGYEKKYSIWVDFFHPFKNNKSKLTKLQKWSFRFFNFVLGIGANVYMFWVLNSLFCYTSQI